MVLATSILLPLYLYPTQGAWNWVTNAISAYPSLPFTIITSTGLVTLRAISLLMVSSLMMQSNQWASSSSSYMTAIANHAHSLNLTVTFNPGTIADEQFFDIADKIVMIEDAYSSYSSGTGDSFETDFEWSGR
ncbi:hypothetical protein DID88_009538 [Monilinia fructigena]|uniref:Uncharacterized protein n=1 Tax=Monilinia fructigena TaxID=38457 RepID=A0A395IFB8_9HELO|nr:hypothetical protein DID88_009538 [Monilinia fructigena]